MSKLRPKQQFTGVAVDEQNVAVTKCPVFDFGAAHARADGIAVVGFRKAGRPDVRNKRTIQYRQTRVNGVGDRVDIIHRLEACEVRCEHAGTCAVPGVDDLVSL